MTLAEPIAVTLEVVGVLDDLGVDYVVGGSLASSGLLESRSFPWLGAMTDLQLGRNPPAKAR